MKLTLNILYIALLVLQLPAMKTISRLFNMNTKSSWRCYFSSKPINSIGNHSGLTGMCHTRNANVSWRGDDKYYKNFLNISEMTADHKLDKNGFELLSLDDKFEKALKILENQYELQTDVDYYYREKREPHYYNLAYPELDNVMTLFKRFTWEHLKKQEKYQNKRFCLIPLHEVGFRTFPRLSDVIPLLHIDFAGFHEDSTAQQVYEMVYETFPEKKFYEFTLENVKKGKPVEIVNVWGPLFHDVEQNIVGFLPPVGKENLSIKSNGSGLVLKMVPDDMFITLCSKMKRGDVYVFRTSGPDASPHASIEIEGRPYGKGRISFELRFLTVLID